MEYLYRLRKRKRESDDNAPPSSSKRLPVEVEGETSNRGSLDTTTTAAMPVSTSSLSKPLLPSANSVPFPASDSRKIGLTKLYEPENHMLAVVDIVLVHGLTGNAYTTWLYKDGKTKTYWPYDLLPQDFPDARIFTFGYDADVTQFWGPVSSNRVSNHAENMLGALSRFRAKTDTEHRKLIFVAHSLGGLVTQNALFLSKSSPDIDIQLLEEHTIGLLFLGTPHHGSDYAAWASVATKMTNCIKSSNREIVAVLKPESEILAAIQKGFHGILSKRNNGESRISVICFFEELRVTPVGHIVPRHSAIIDAYPSYGIRANHMDMSKFDSAGNEGYNAVEGEIFKWVKKLRSRGQQAFSCDLSRGFLSNSDTQCTSKKQDSIDAANPNNFDGNWTRRNIHPLTSQQSREDSLSIANIANVRESMSTNFLTDTSHPQLSVMSSDYEPDPASTTHLEQKEKTSLPLVNVSTPQSRTRKRPSSLTNNCQELTKLDFDQHVQSFNPDTPRKCNFPGCLNNNGNGFSRMKALTYHIRMEHLEDQKNCPFPGCDNKEGNGFERRTLIGHIQSVHLDVSYDCSVSDCDNNKGKGFVRSDHLKTHIRDVHSDIKQHCPHPGCDDNYGKGFSSVYSLNSHFNSGVHSDSRYDCSLANCNNFMGRGFSSTRGLKKHIKEVHPN